ncbi:MAG: sensor histidine kinase [Terriglobales bacterium]
MASEGGGDAPARTRPQTALLLLGLAAGTPALAVALVLLWLPRDQVPAFAAVLLTGVCVAAWAAFTFAARRRTLFALGTFANMMAAVRGGDYSVRARGAQHEDAFGAIAAEINELSEALRLRRVSGLEAGALLDKVIEAIDIAVFAFDDGHKLRLVNPAGATLMASSAERLLGSSAAELKLAAMLDGDSNRLEEVTFPGGPGRWDIRHTHFRQDGRPHRLLIVSDLSQPLRQEERMAWYRLIRVLGHEINNSLAPVISLTGSLAGLLRDPPADGWREDMHRGLDVIADRASALNRFMSAYTRLARLPQPELREADAGGLLQAAVRLEQRLAVAIRPGPPLIILADPDQISQVLINLIRNAVDAALGAWGREQAQVTAGWDLRHSWLEFWIQDNGPGLATTANLFVPFFTTKPGGSGIGLVLSRQIAEAHRGRLTLVSRRGQPGTEARLYLPLD